MAKQATEMTTDTTICVVVNTTTLKRPLRRRLRISLEIPPHKVPIRPVAHVNAPKVKEASPSVSKKPRPCMNEGAYVAKALIKPINDALPIVINLYSCDFKIGTRSLRNERRCAYRLGAPVSVGGPYGKMRHIKSDGSMNGISR